MTDLNRCEWNRVNHKAPKKAVQVLQRFDLDPFRYNDGAFAVGKPGEEPLYYCGSFNHALWRMGEYRKAEQDRAAKAAADRADRAAKAAAKAADKAAVAEVKAAEAKSKPAKPDPIALLRSEMQAEMQAAIAKGIADALAQMQATALSKPREAACKQATAS
jgi:hypothetical protein